MEYRIFRLICFLLRSLLVYRCSSFRWGNYLECFSIALIASVVLQKITSCDYKIKVVLYEPYLARAFCSPGMCILQNYFITTISNYPMSITCTSQSPAHLIYVDRKFLLWSLPFYRESTELTELKFIHAVDEVWTKNLKR